MREKTFDKVKDFVKENEMLARNCAVIAGVSGGNDSMTMLHLLRRLRDAQVPETICGCPYGAGT